MNWDVVSEIDELELFWYAISMNEMFIQIMQQIFFFCFASQFLFWKMKKMLRQCQPNILG